MFRTVALLMLFAVGCKESPAVPVTSAPEDTLKVGSVKKAYSLTGGGFAHCFASASAYDSFIADKGDSRNLLNGNAWWVNNDSRVEVVENNTSKQLVKVKILDGKHAGKIGWIHATELKD